jgi:hypothetical protein
MAVSVKWYLLDSQAHKTQLRGIHGANITEMKTLFSTLQQTFGEINKCDLLFKLNGWECTGDILNRS